MKNVKIQELTLTNFKGIKSLHVDFSDEQTNIFGDNGTGKTSIFDAFTWLLFGKDSTDRQNFEIKTLDKNNNPIPKINHEVEGLINAEGKLITIKRTLSEKWVTRRGSSESEFAGNETIYEWNGVPLLAGDFSNKVSDIVDEKVFKLITSPTAFNSLKWQDQREVLIGMTNITDEFIAEGNTDFKNLLITIGERDITLDGLEKSTKASLKKAKNEIKSIPTRIDEVERGKPEAIDFENIKTESKKLISKKEKLEAQISDKLKAEHAVFENKKKLQKSVYEIETEITKRKNGIKSEARTSFLSNTEKPREFQKSIDLTDSGIKDAETTEKNLNTRIESSKLHLHRLNTSLDELRDTWQKKNAETFTMDESECKCPTCKREFDSELLDDKRKEMEKIFADDKRTQLKLINSKGEGIKLEKEQTESLISSLNEKLKKCKSDLKDLWTSRAELSTQLKEVGTETTKSEEQIYNDLLLANDAWIKELENNIKELNAKINDEKPVDVSELKAEKATIQNEIDAFNVKLNDKKVIELANNRIETLKKEESELASSINKLDKQLYNIEQFTKAKMEALENSINANFSFVKFKLFETQINGGETPTCKALVEGVPFSDANTASKINAGLDIINTLCKYYQSSAPVFIDNRESVIDIIECQSQIVNLIVSEPDKKLRIESNVKQLETV